MGFKPVIDTAFRKPPARGRRWENAVKNIEYRRTPVRQTAISSMAAGQTLCRTLPPGMRPAPKILAILLPRLAPLIRQLRPLVASDGKNFQRVSDHFCLPSTLFRRNLRRFKGRSAQPTQLPKQSSSQQRAHVLFATGASIFKSCRRLYSHSCLLMRLCCISLNNYEYQEYALLRRRATL